MKPKSEETLTLDAHQRSHYTIGLYTHVLQRSTKKRFCQQLIVFLSHYDTRNGLRICLTSIWAIYVMIANNVTHCALIERKSFTAVYLHVEQSLGVWSWLSNVWWDCLNSDRAKPRSPPWYPSLPQSHNDKFASTLHLTS